MAKKLKLALSNPVLPLVLKASALSVLIFYLRVGDFGILKPILFVLAFLALYLKPSLGASRYWVSAATLIFIIFQAPQVIGLIGFYVNASLSIMGFMLLGVKNLIFVRKQGAYYLMHLTLVAGLAGLFSLGLISHVAFFAILFFLFREFYSVVVSEKLELLSLVSVLEGMLLLQIAWATSFFPTSFLVNGSFLVLITYIFHDAFVHYFKNQFDKNMVIRSAILFLAIVGFVLVLRPLWGLQ